MRINTAQIALMAAFTITLLLATSCNLFNATSNKLPATWPDQNITMVYDGRVLSYDDRMLTRSPLGAQEMSVLEVKTALAWKDIRSCYISLMSNRSSFAKVTDMEDRKVAILEFMSNDPKVSLTITRVFPSNTYKMTYREYVPEQD